MSSFEQETADAIRNLIVAGVVLAVGLVLAIGLASWGMLNAASANRAVKAGLLDQTSNRTSNVAHWCEAINALDQTLTRYVALFPHVPRLHLIRLNCKQIERTTLASTKPH